MPEGRHLEPHQGVDRHDQAAERNDVGEPSEWQQPPARAEDAPGEQGEQQVSGRDGNRAAERTDAGEPDRLEAGVDSAEGEEQDDGSGYQQAGLANVAVSERRDGEQYASRGAGDKSRACDLLGRRRSRQRRIHRGDRHERRQQRVPGETRHAFPRASMR